MYRFGRSSKSRLEGVDPDLVATAEYALDLLYCQNYYDLTIPQYGGFRTQADQDILISQGASQVKVSKHMTGEAVDLMPIVGGAARSDLVLLMPVADAMRIAADEAGIRLRWGGCWQPLDECGDPDEAVRKYIIRKYEAGKRPFVDAYHFEIVK